MSSSKRTSPPLPISRDSSTNACDYDDEHAQSIRQQSGVDANGPDDVSPGQKTAGLPFDLTLTLQNTGSVARDHLSSERTFLAYVRTSLSFSSAGVALVQLFRVSVSSSEDDSSPNSDTVASYSRPLGAALIAFGMVVLTVGTQRYFTVQRALPKGLFPAARITVFLHAVSLATLVGIIFGVIVTVH